MRECIKDGFLAWYQFWNSTDAFWLQIKLDINGLWITLLTPELSPTMNTGVFSTKQAHGTFSRYFTEKNWTCSKCIHVLNVFPGAINLDLAIGPWIVCPEKFALYATYIRSKKICISNGYYIVSRFYLKIRCHLISKEGNFMRNEIVCEEKWLAPYNHQYNFKRTLYISMCVCMCFRLIQ